jgi:hypothetical protein
MLKHLHLKELIMLQLLSRGRQWLKVWYSKRSLSQRWSTRRNVSIYHQARSITTSLIRHSYGFMGTCRSLASVVPWSLEIMSEKKHVANFQLNLARSKKLDLGVFAPHMRVHLAKFPVLLERLLYSERICTFNSCALWSTDDQRARPNHENQE